MGGGVKERLGELLENAGELVAFIFDLVVCKVGGIILFVLGEVMLRLGAIRRLDPDKLKRLEGKVVLITGANSGIGECLAKYFYLAGCKLILAARRRDELQRVRDELGRMTTTMKGQLAYAPTVLELDISKWESIPEKLGGLQEPIDILVNNAGIFNQSTILQTLMEVDEHIVKVNYLGTLALTKIICKKWMESGAPGHVVFVSSILGKATIPNSLSYSASKHAMQALRDCLRLEVRSVKVTAPAMSRPPSP